MHLSPAEYVIKVFNGVCNTARAVGCHHSAVCKWRLPKERRGCDGGIPSRARKIILEKAKELQLDITSEDLDFGRTIYEHSHE